jgi:nucleotide-binding universal stress UspA family protein
VVLSTCGEKGLYRMGSTAEKVVRNSPVPVITVPVEQPAEV